MVLVMIMFYVWYPDLVQVSLDSQQEPWMAGVSCQPTDWRISFATLSVLDLNV